MRVFVTGATGALGRHLVPGLVAAGHEVTATTRTPAKAAAAEELARGDVAVVVPVHPGEPGRPVAAHAGGVADLIHRKR